MWQFFTLSCCPPEACKVHQWPTQSPLQKSRFPEAIGLSCIWPETQLFRHTHTHILTSSWKKYWEVLGFLGSSWKQREGSSLSVCELYTRTTQSYCRAVSLRSRASIILSAPPTADVQNDYVDTLLSSKPFLESLPDSAISRNIWALGVFFKKFKYYYFFNDRH